jgi:hypothetical protein
LEHDAEKWFSEKIMLKQRDEIMIRSNRIMIEEMEGVAGISRPRRWHFPGGGSISPLPSVPSGGITPPSVGGYLVVLHEDADRAMVTEGWPT